ncbi:hypothetical protein N7468_010621 [Penicillium chermesinum]|uniref:Major facilitator superfamily (MFS) profile domain-containing protein n=1 Tax=Penicillium chermesinum TaxID=63820 RepID=A0A9W9N836_9EURO|nr:uncharacterized protein N7468_010621 [Penicillium chermesinum]KAJ5214942.1 hypothetical protein N7468_010621 [Penicillium chermesinum]KAJ6141555.1 hypothetical protein N7470_009945 [Penicillium chermesinum]
MGFKLSALVPAGYGKAIHNAPREVIFNRQLMFSAIVYATAAIPATWDQGSASVVPSLPGFEKAFGISSGANAGQIRNFISIVYIGYAAGAAMSFFINDTIGRRWSFRLYTAIWIVGQLVAILTPTLAGLYASRIIVGIGIGSLSVTGPVSIAEIAPQEIRGLLTSWYVVAMSSALLASTFCVYGIIVHVAASKLQYQLVWFPPCIFMAFIVIATFFISESPKWLMVVNKREEAVYEMSRLRGLPNDHPRVVGEILEIQHVLSNSDFGVGDRRPPLGTRLKIIVKETFTVPSNLRRVQQCLMSYLLAQLSGANSVTSYFVPILTLVGMGGNKSHDLFLTGMYTLMKLCCTIIASFFFIDVLGRRKSLFVGATIQMISDLYLGIFIKYQQQGAVSHSASQAAVAALFIHAFGYAVGLYTLPYVFGGELWPNHLRSFGAALGQTFHWLFLYAMNFGTPSLLEKTNNWGAFIFFAAWCFVALLYVYLIVPEISGLSVQEIDSLFKGPWLKGYGRVRSASGLEGVEPTKTDEDPLP